MTAAAGQNATDNARTPVWERAFLKALRQMGNITRACSAAKIERSTAYRHREGSATFAAAWDEALEEAADRLEAEAWRRAVRGTRKPIYFRDQRIGYERQYSDQLMTLLLKAHRPERFRERLDVSLRGVQPETITRLLDAIEALNLKPSEALEQFIQECHAASAAAR